jgi:hypothetical protein
LLPCALQWFFFVVLFGTSPFSELAPLPGHGFDRRIEAAVSNGLILIQRHAEVSKRSIIEGGAQEVSIYFAPGELVIRTYA